MPASIAETTGPIGDPSDGIADFITLAERGLLMNGHKMTECGLQVHLQRRWRHRLRGFRRNLFLTKTSKSAAFALPYWTFKRKEGGASSGVGLGSFPVSVGSGGDQLPSCSEPASAERPGQDGVRRSFGMLREPRTRTRCRGAEWRGSGVRVEAQVRSGRRRRAASRAEAVYFLPIILNASAWEEAGAQRSIRFVTGDRVDVSIDLANGEYCVVEIEIEGESTRIGAHQALKYRALRAGELDSMELPHACLVAYSIPQDVKDFCERHGVLALEIQPEQ